MVIVILGVCVFALQLFLRKLDKRSYIKTSIAPNQLKALARVIENSDWAALKAKVTVKQHDILVAIKSDDLNQEFSYSRPSQPENLFRDEEAQVYCAGNNNVIATVQVTYEQGQCQGHVDAQSIFINAYSPEMLVEYISYYLEESLETASTGISHARQWESM